MNETHAMQLGVEPKGLSFHRCVCPEKSKYKEGFRL